MKLQLVKFQCKKCNTFFEAPELGYSSYGEFILRSRGEGKEAYLNALEDDTYEEVKLLLESNPRVTERNTNGFSELLWQHYGEIACDPDQFGFPFQIGAPPKCPACGAQEVSSWEYIDPPKFLEKTIEPVTHIFWKSFSEQEKKLRINQILMLD